MAKDNIVFSNPPCISAFAAIGGKKESEGPLSSSFDAIFADTKCGQSTWEKAESIFQRHSIEQLLNKRGVKLSDVNAVFAGDLQCQCTASAYAMRSLDVPFFGLYGACSTMAEGIILAASMVAGNIMRRAIAMSSSHFCAAERQYRTPLDYGGKRTPTSQWTVTSAGSVMIEAGSLGPHILSVSTGRVCDFNVKDINNMGAAMAPAAANTLLQYFADTSYAPSDFDAIFTGDLGAVGSTLMLDLLDKEGLHIKNHEDCGLLVYDKNTQKVQAGGSGAGCSAAVLSALVLPKLQKKEYKRVLFLSTGALMSQTTFLQGESIPGIAHLLELGI
ncbi:MAG: stage V sporulation protein AD [Oscillospiraceae bacterium]